MPKFVIERELAGAGRLSPEELQALRPPGWVQLRQGPEGLESAGPLEPALVKGRRLCTLYQARRGPSAAAS